MQRSYKQWFALANWTSLPGVLAVLPAIPLLLTSKSVADRMPPPRSRRCRSTSCSFTAPWVSPGYQLFTNLNLIQIFTVFLVVLGIKMWSGRSWLFALVYALLPVVVIGGVGRSWRSDRASGTRTGCHRARFCSLPI